MSYLRVNMPASNIKLTIVGWSNVKRDIDYFREMIKNNNVEETVTLMGTVSNSELPKIFESHDIFVFPSSKRRIEGCPAVILESLACGLPIVANLGPGTNEILKDGVTCVEVLSDTPKDLAQSIIKVAENKELYNSLQENGHKMVKSKHSLESYVASFDDLLKQAASAKHV